MGAIMTNAGCLFEASVLVAPNTRRFLRREPIIVAVGSSQQIRRLGRAIVPKQCCWELPTSPLPRSGLPNSGVQS